MKKAIINNELNLINMYINNEDIDGTMKKKLNENPSFMFNVLKQSKNTKFLKDCAPNVVNNIGFVLNVIELFKNDINDEFISFLDEVLDLYDKQPQLRILCAIDEIGNGKEKLNKYRIALNAKIQTDIVSYKRMLLNIKGSLEGPSIGFGYAYYEHCNDFEFNGDDVLNGDNTVLNCYVKHFVKEALNNDMELISYMAHRKFVSRLNFNSGELKMAIVDYIYKLDEVLGEYIYENLDTVKFLDKYIDRAKEDWCSYTKRREDERFTAVFQEIQNYADYDTPDSPFGVNDLLYLVFKDRNELNKLYNHDYDFVEPRFIYERSKNIEKVVAIIDDDDSRISISDDDMKYVKKASEIIDNIFSSRTTKELEEYRSSIPREDEMIDIKPLASRYDYERNSHNISPAKISKIPIRIRKDDNDKH